MAGLALRDQRLAPPHERPPSLGDVEYLSNVPLVDLLQLLKQFGLVSVLRFHGGEIAIVTFHRSFIIARQMDKLENECHVLDYRVNLVRCLSNTMACVDLIELDPENSTANLACNAALHSHASITSCIVFFAVLLEHTHYIELTKMGINSCIEMQQPQQHHRHNHHHVNIY